MISTLLKSVREYRRPSILCPLLMVGEAVMEILIPFLMTGIVGEITELSIDPGYAVDVSKIIRVSVEMVICALVALLCGIEGGRLSAKASAGFARNLRQDMYDNMQTYSFANIDNYSTASLITRITTDVTNVQNAYQMSVRMLVRAPVLFIAAIVMTCVIEPKMALVFVGAAIVLGVILAVCMVKVVSPFRTMFRKYDDLNRVVQEDLTAVRVVKSYVREDEEIAKMNAATEEVYKYSVKAEKIMTFMSPSVTLVMYLSNIVILIMGTGMYLQPDGWLVSGMVSPDNLQAMISYSVQILQGVMSVATCLNFIFMSRGSMERICEVLGEKTTVPNPADPVLAVRDGSVTFENVSFAYSLRSGTGVLRNIDLSIGSGETVGIIGATGSGKTSLVSLIPRLYDVSGGAVKVGGVDVRDYDLDVLRGEVAMVLQKNVLFSGTVAENLRWGDESATDEDLREAARQACADEFIESLPGGYDYDLGQGGVNVSGGQKQRLCIARALLRKPKVIIFDDSTSAVDTRTDAVIRDNLRKYAPDTTKIIIAQRVASVQDADRIVVLDDGAVSGVGTHDELLRTNEIYRDVYESQMKGETDNA